MAGLFEIFTRMTDDDIRIQIAFLKNITLANVAKETGNKMLGGFAGFANSITEAFSGTELTASSSTLYIDLSYLSE